MTNSEPEELSSHDKSDTPTRIPRWAVPVTSLGLVVAFGIGLLVGWQAFDSDERPSSDAARACRLVTDVPKNVKSALEGTDDVLNEPLIWRLQAVGPLAVAAAKGDDTYAEFEGIGMQVFNGASRLGLDRLEKATDKLRSKCADLGL